MSWAGSDGFNWDVNADITLRPLWQYYKSYGIQKCPADPSTVKVSSPPAGSKYSDGAIAPRVRSIAMNWFLGGFGDDPTAQPVANDGPWPQFYPAYTKSTQLGNMGMAPGPSKTFVFIDERPDCINWGNYLQDMGGAAYNHPNPAPAQYEFTEDMPASLHGGSCGVSFADNHAEIHRWRDDVVLQPQAPNGTSLNSPRSGTPGQGSVFADAFGKDVAWMQDVSARPH